jgi:hypothetical protein
MATNEFHNLDPNELREAVKPRTPKHCTLSLMRNGTLRVRHPKGERLDLRRQAGLWRYDTRQGHKVVETGAVDGLEGFERLANGLGLDA